MNEICDFGPELLLGCENAEVNYLAESRQSYYQEDAICICDDIPATNPAFKNCGTLIMDDSLVGEIPPLAMNIILVRLQDMDSIRQILQSLLD